jgi:hypothetical protein
MRKSPCYFTDITGNRYGKWTVLSRVANRYRSIYYLCRCDCGIEAQVGKKQLVGGKSLSCGCLKNFKSYKNRLNRKWGKHYSPGDEFLIRQWYPRTGTKKLAEFLGRPKASVRYKANMMGLKVLQGAEEYFFRPDEWQIDELNILHKYYPSGGTAACLPLLPNRNKDAIWSKAQKEGLLLNRNRKKKAKQRKAA